MKNIKNIKKSRLVIVLAILVIAFIYIINNYSLTFSKISDINTLDDTLKSNTYIYFFEFNVDKIRGKTIDLDKSETLELIKIFDEYSYIKSSIFSPECINDGYNISITFFSNKKHYSIIELDERGYVHVMDNDKWYKTDLFGNKNGMELFNKIMNHFEIYDTNDLE